MKKITIFLFLFVSLLTNAQSIQFLEKLLMKTRIHLAAATIRQRNNKGFTTDFEGEFSMQLPKGRYAFKFHF